MRHDALQCDLLSEEYGAAPFCAPAAVLSMMVQRTKTMPCRVPFGSSLSAHLHRLKEALGLVDMRTLDHVIVARAETVSFAEQGLI